MYPWTSADEEDYKIRKGVNKFNQVLEGTKELSGGKATLGVGFLIDEQNYTQVEKMYELRIGLGADYVQFRPIVNFDIRNPGRYKGNTGWMELATRMIISCSFGRPNVIADIKRFQELRDNGKPRRGENFHGYKECYWSELQTVITPNGKVWTCVNKRENAEAYGTDKFFHFLRVPPHPVLIRAW